MNSFYRVCIALAGFCALAFAVFLTAGGRDALLKIGLALMLAGIIHNFMGYLLGYWGCRAIGMKENDCRAISLEVGMQD